MKKVLLLALSLSPLAINAMHHDKKQKMNAEQEQELAEITISATLINVHNNNSTICSRTESHWTLPRHGKRQTLKPHCTLEVSHDNYDIKFQGIYNDPKNSSIQFTCVIDQLHKNKPSKIPVTLPYNSDKEVKYPNDNNGSTTQELVLRFKNIAQFK